MADPETNLRRRRMQESPAPNERRRGTRTLIRRVGALESRIVHVEKNLSMNTEITQQVYENTRAIVELSQAWATLLEKAHKWTQRGVRVSKNIAIVAGAITGVYIAVEHIATTDLGKLWQEWKR